MKSRAILTGLLLSTLTVGVAGAQTARQTRVTTATRTTQNEPRRVVAFKTERTDSWLCENVSVFFCDDVMPKLTTTPDPTITFMGKVPDRSRK